LIEEAIVFDHELAPSSRHTFRAAIRSFCVFKHIRMGCEQIRIPFGDRRRGPRPELPDIPEKAIRALKHIPPTVIADLTWACMQRMGETVQFVYWSHGLPAGAAMHIDLARELARWITGKEKTMPAITSPLVPSAPLSNVPMAPGRLRRIMKRELLE
jgi:hypothetical protein